MAIPMRMLKNGEIHHPIVCVFWLPDRRIILRDNDPWEIEQSRPVMADDIDFPYLTYSAPDKWDYSATAKGEKFYPEKVLQIGGRRRSDVEHYRLIF